MDEEQLHSIVQDLRKFTMLKQSEQFRSLKRDRRKKLITNQQFEHIQHQLSIFRYLKKNLPHWVSFGKLVSDLHYTKNGKRHHFAKITISKILREFEESQSIEKAIRTDIDVGRYRRVFYRFKASYLDRTYPEGVEFRT